MKACVLEMKESKTPLLGSVFSSQALREGKKKVQIAEMLKAAWVCRFSCLQWEREQHLPLKPSLLQAFVLAWDRRAQTGAFANNKNGTINPFL
jgi:hypothetical protein